jgi:hypothetical protein
VQPVYFLLPVAWLKVSLTDWLASLRPFWAESRMPPPSFWAESPPERVVSPTFWVEDFWPSGELLVTTSKGSVHDGLTRLDGRGGLVTKSGDGLAGLLGV